MTVKPTTDPEILKQAVIRNDVAGLEQMIRNGADPNQEISCSYRETEYFPSLLTFSVWEGKWDATKCLLRNGAVPDPGSQQGAGINASLLFEAIGRDAPVDVIDMIIKASPKESLDRFAPGRGCGPLHSAATRGKTDVIRLLVENGANIEAPDNSKRTPLFLAAAYGFEDIAFYLIEKGADIKTQSYCDDTLLMAAAGSGSLRLAKHLVKHGCPVNKKNERDLTALYFASIRRENNRPMLEFLTESGADINIKDFYHRNLAEVTLRYNHEDSFLFLAGKGAALHVISKENETPLHLAAQNGLAKAADFLCNPDHGQCIDARDLVQRTPLHLAIQNDHNDITRALLGAGADINAQDKEGATPLMMAAVNQHGRAAIELFLKHGAKLDLCDNRGRTALAVAVQCDNWLNAETLLQHGADIKDVLKGDKPPAFEEKVLNSSIMIRLMLDHGIEPDLLGQTVLGQNGWMTFEHWTGRTRPDERDGALVQSVKKKGISGILPQLLDEERKNIDLESFLQAQDSFGNSVLEIIGARGEIPLLLAPKYWKNNVEGAQEICDRLPPVYRAQGKDAIETLRAASNIDRLDRILKARNPRPRP